MFIDLDRIKNEMMMLPPFDPQICLQGVKGVDDPFFGCGNHTKRIITTITKKIYYKEIDFVVPIFDMPYTNDVLDELKMYRTRIIKLQPNNCYTIHRDPTKRIHIPIVTNDKCLMIVNNEVMYLPAGSHYVINTTHSHTAINGSNFDRIHIVGCIE